MSILNRGILFLTLSAAIAAGQTTSPASPTSPASGGTFSMETEVFAYRALQSDAEAIACDVGGFIGGVAVVPDDKGSCTPVPNGRGSSILIVSSTSTVAANFQLWRANMAIGKELLALATAQNCPGETKGLVDTAPVVLSLLQGVVALFATSQSSMGVLGTIQDQALMSGVARQLKALQFDVLMPDVYTPFSFNGLDYTKSPFLSLLQKLINARGCMYGELLHFIQDFQDATKNKADDQAKLNATPAPDAPTKKQLNDDIGKQGGILSLDSAKIAALQSAIAGIDGYVATLAGAPPAAAPAAGATTPPASPTPPSPAPTSAIVSVLNADGLAQAFGVNADGSMQPLGKWHLLSLKALESGGALITTTSVLNSKVHFSGGAAGTYSLFSLDAGKLDCAGNVVDYGGYVGATDFAQAFKKGFPESLVKPSEQLLFKRGGCLPVASPKSGSNPVMPMSGGAGRQAEGGSSETTGTGSKNGALSRRQKASR